MYMYSAWRRGSSASSSLAVAVRRHAEGAAARSGTTGSFCPCGTRVEQAGRHDVAAACLTACGCRWLARTESRCGVAGCADSRTSSRRAALQAAHTPLTLALTCMCFVLKVFFWKDIVSRCQFSETLAAFSTVHVNASAVEDLTIGNPSVPLAHEDCLVTLCLSCFSGSHGTLNLSE